MVIRKERKKRNGGRMKEKIAAFFPSNYPDEWPAAVSRIQDMFKYIRRYEKHLITPGKRKLSKDKFFLKIFVVGQYRPGSSVRGFLVNIRLVINAIFCFIKNHRKYDYKVIYATSPTFFPVLAAAICGKVTKTPVIADIRDPWTAGLISSGVPPSSLTYKIAHMAEKFGYDNSDCVVVVTNGLGKLIKDEYGVPEEKISVVPNGADTEVFKQYNKLEARRKLGLPIAGTILMYHGSFTAYHNVPKLVKVFSEYIRGGRKKNIYLMLVGNRSKINLDKISEKNKLLNQNLIFVKEVPREEIPYYISASDIGIVPIKRDRHFQYMIPLKLYEYAACGKPVLLFVGTKESKNLVRKCDIGAIAMGNVKSFGLALATLFKRYETFSDNAIKMSQKTNRKKSAEMLGKIIDNLISFSKVY